MGRLQGAAAGARSPADPYTYLVQTMRHCCRRSSPAACVAAAPLRRPAGYPPLPFPSHPPPTAGRSTRSIAPPGAARRPRARCAGPPEGRGRVGEDSICGARWRRHRLPDRSHAVSRAAAARGGEGVIAGRGRRADVHGGTGLERPRVGCRAGATLQCTRHVSVTGRVPYAAFLNL